MPGSRIYAEDKHFSRLRAPMHKNAPAQAAQPRGEGVCAVGAQWICGDGTSISTHTQAKNTPCVSLEHYGRVSVLGVTTDDVPREIVSKPALSKELTLTKQFLPFLRAAGGPGAAAPLSPRVLRQVGSIGYKQRFWGVCPFVTGDNKAPMQTFRWCLCSRISYTATHTGKCLDLFLGECDEHGGCKVNSTLLIVYFYFSVGYLHWHKAIRSQTSEPCIERDLQY